MDGPLKGDGFLAQWGNTVVPVVLQPIMAHKPCPFLIFESPFKSLISSIWSLCSRYLKLKQLDTKHMCSWRLPEPLLLLGAWARSLSPSSSLKPEPLLIGDWAPPCWSLSPSAHKPSPNRAVHGQTLCNSSLLLRLEARRGSFSPHLRLFRFHISVLTCQCKPLQMLLSISAGKNSWSKKLLNLFSAE